MPLAGLYQMKKALIMYLEGAKMGEKETEMWRRQIMPATDVEPNFAIFQDNAREASDLVLRGLFAVTHAELVDAEIKLDMLANELERRAR